MYMSRSYSISKARQKLAQLVRDAERGKPALLTRRGRTVAVMLSADDYQRLSAARTDLWSAIGAFRQSHDLTELAVDEIFTGLRDRSPGREVAL